MPVGKGSILRATIASSALQTLDSKDAKDAGDIKNILLEIPLIQIVEVGDGARNEPLNQEVAELVASIRRYGMIEPVILRQVSNKKFQLLSGARRFQAVKELGLETITSRVLEGLNDQEAKEIFQDLHRKKASDTFKETKFHMVSTISREMPTYLL